MPIEVCLNDGLRLAGALLAAGNWPEVEQKQKPYKPHHVAESARRYFAPWREMRAVHSAQMLGSLAEELTASGIRVQAVEARSSVRERLWRRAMERENARLFL